MPTQTIVALLIQERDKLDAAIAALSGGAKRLGRPPKKSLVQAVQPAVATTVAKPKRKMSAAGRKAIADAARRRWKLIKAGKAPSPFAGTVKDVRPKTKREGR